MTTTKLTQRAIYARIMDVMGDDQDVVEFCERKIAQLDKPRAKSVAKQQEYEQFLCRVSDALDGEMTAKQVADKLGDVSWQKVSNGLRRLILNGVVKQAGYDDEKHVLYQLV